MGTNFFTVCRLAVLDGLGELAALIGNTQPKTLAGAAVVLRRALAAIEGHDGRSPFRDDDRVEARLLTSALALVARLG